jgi:hypothetical protein
MNLVVYKSHQEAESVTMYEVKLSSRGRDLFLQVAAEMQEDFDADKDIEIMTPLGLINGEVGELSFFVPQPTLPDTIAMLLDAMAGEFGETTFTGCELKEDYFVYKACDVPAEEGIAVTDGHED